jgi:hypothetical protein
MSAKPFLCMAVWGMDVAIVACSDVELTTMTLYLLSRTSSKDLIGVCGGPTVIL